MNLVICLWLSVRVKTYSIGFGPRIFGIKFYKGKYSIRIGNRMPTNPNIWFRKDNTEYRLAPIFLGGFCALEGELKSIGKEYELASKPFGQKLQIALAGVGLNFLTGLLAIFSIAIKNKDFLLGLKNTAIMVYSLIRDIIIGLYLLCTFQVEITTASDVNQIMSNISLEYIIIYFGIFSILMAFFNSIPFPCLDGSLPFMWILEKLTKGKISNILQFIWFIGFVVLMILQFVILYFWIFS